MLAGRFRAAPSGEFALGGGPAGSWIIVGFYEPRARAARLRGGAPTVVEASAELSVPIRSPPLPRAWPTTLAALATAALCAAARAEPPLALQPSTVLEPPPRGDAALRRPIFFSADRLRVRPDVEAEAEGDVEFRRAGTVIRADTLRYEAADDRATARGHVRIVRGGVVYAGPELQLKVQRFQGFFLEPEFQIDAFGVGGRARRVDFLDIAHMRAEATIYSSCPRDGSGTPDWLLRADRVTMDFDADEGVAEGAVLRFLDVPILTLPTMSFPLSDKRRSGWLPPSMGIDSRNGLMLGLPWYWNIAPNRDATILPTVITRRGLAIEGEFRYLEPRFGGQVAVQALPDDRIAGHSRGAFRMQQDGQIVDDWRLQVGVLSVSDQNYWKDFPQFASSSTPRLLAQDVRASRPYATLLGSGEVYARTQFWQVMQTGSGDELIVAPYQRSPQLGWRADPASHAGFLTSFETEINHFTLPTGSASPNDPTGWRWHALGSVSRPFGDGAWWLTPKLMLNAASYSVDRTGTALPPHASRLIPTVSLDTGAVFERESQWFGRAQRQTLEPRLFYANTPYRDQSQLPNFDSALKTFNFVSAYSENIFSGIDRVADLDQFTAGVTTRLVDPVGGAENLRLALAQQVLLREQRITSSGVPVTRRLSDLLLEGSTSVVRDWHLDAAVEYSPNSHQVINSTLGARYSPGPFRTVSAGYRLVNNLPTDVVNINAEQLELGWQWPVYRGTARPLGASSGCGGTLYAVGRLNYSLSDSRTTDSVVGFEYDAGCWVGRVVFQRQSTGLSEATTRVMFQLELVGLSRLGSNPLQVLKDNIPGYRLLREPRGFGGGGADLGPPVTTSP